MAKKQKWYVVWEGRATGVFETWEDCREQVLNHPGAKYASFPTKEEAVEAFRSNGNDDLLILQHIALHSAQEAQKKTRETAAPLDYSTIPEINLTAWAVDGACSGNPGDMEYRCVRVADGTEVFHMGPMAEGTNNVAEYLALVHALALLHRNNDTLTPVYTDSATAVAWVRNRGCRTQLQHTPANDPIFNLLARANVWLQTHTPRNPILRWQTSLWGEIPADFHRK